ncbi:hypothetical protein F4859DRAFT_512902 [Xylaria cf. heliscus]|nr:hypothetical protein F4859DRAFT_512902 [Xylaria cf. heliscus]
MPYMAQNESVFRSYVQCINQNRWKELTDVIHFPLRFNSEVITTPEAFEACGTANGRIKLSTDSFTVDNESGRLAVTSTVELRPTTNPDRTVRFMKQTIVWIKDGKIYKIITTGTPMQEVERQLFWPGYTFTPDLISAYSNGHYNAGRPRFSAQALETIYRGHISCINGRTMQSGLAVSCHPHVIHDARRLSQEEYRFLIQELLTAIPDVELRIDEIVVDQSLQRAAVRLVLSGTPTGKLFGVEPNGCSVRFYEFATYFFLDGKIDRIWSIVDWDSYRKQLTQTPKARRGTLSAGESSS